jgi:hypothetical protein
MENNISSSVRVITDRILGCLNIENHSFLNWDDDIYMTPYNDLILSIKEYVARITGWSSLEVSLIKGILRVTNDEGTLVIYDVVNHHEVYGRLRHIGVTSRLLKEIERIAL